MNAFPWKNAMKFGLGVLRLAPKDFWAMTPRELSAAYSFQSETGRPQAPISKAGFTDLMRKFPDKDKQN